MPNFTWYHNGEKINETLIITQNVEPNVITSILRIETVSYEHHGSYNCMLSNEEGMDDMQINLIVRCELFSFGILHDV